MSFHSNRSQVQGLKTLMAEEIERKFLVNGYTWKKYATGLYCRQGYLCLENERIVRVRNIEGNGFLTIKGIAKGIKRPEYEYKIPVEDANEILDYLCKRPLIEKKRYITIYEGTKWEIDEFMGENKGLIIAEVELACENQKIILPEWVGKEVSGDPRYYNAGLVRYPYKVWKK